MKTIELNYPEVPISDMQKVPITVALGFFDGFHRGHQALVREAVFRAEQNGTKTAVYTFDRYPKRTCEGYAQGAKPRHETLHSPTNAPKSDAQDAPESSPEQIFQEETQRLKEIRKTKGLLQTQRQKIRRLSEEGIDYLFIQTFDETFQSLSPEDFLNYMSKALMDVQCFLVGEDFHFGQNGAGDVHYLQDYCKRHGIQCRIIPSVNYGGAPISSSRIRQAVSVGDFPLVTQLLGRHYTLRGKVVAGNQMARSFDFPTANFRPEASKILPPYGVYVTRAKVDGIAYPAITNIGLRPTVNNTDPNPLVETTIFGTKIDLYGKSIEVDFLRFIREETHFRSFLIMTTQIHRDIEEARDWHASSEDFHLGYAGKGSHIYLCHAERFREGTFDLYFYLPLDPVKTSARALLARILTSSSAKHPTRQDFLQALEACYGASFEGESYSHGSTQVIHFHVSSISRGLEGRRPIREATALAFDALLHPNLDADGLVPEDIFETEKRSYIAELLLLRDDKNYETERRLFKELFAGTDISIDPLGEPEIIQSLSREDLRDAWQEMCEFAQIDAIIAGSYNLSSISQTAKYLKALRGQHLQLDAEDEVLVESASESAKEPSANESASEAAKEPSTKPAEKSPVKSINQEAKHYYSLIPGRRPKPPILSPTTSTFWEPGQDLAPFISRETYPGKGRSIVYFAWSGIPPYVSSDIVSFQMMAHILGGNARSRLYTRLREELALVYQVKVQTFLYQNLMIIQLTCDPSKVDRIIDEVLAQVAQLQAEPLGKEELREHRKLAENDYRMAADDLESMVHVQYLDTITGRAMNIADQADLLKSADPEKVQHHAQALRLHKIFVYEAAAGVATDEEIEDHSHWVDEKPWVPKEGQDE